MEPPTDEFAAAPAKTSRRPRIPWPAALIVGVLAGVGIGFAGSKTTTNTEVERTPQACIDALDVAAQGFDYSAEFAGATSEAFAAAASFDVAGIEAATSQMGTITDKVTALNAELGPLARECRSKA